jgi:hypothetical protein
MKLAVLLALVFALPIQAKDKPQDAPAVSDSHKAAYFKAQVEIDNAAPAWQKANADMQKAVADLGSDCGDKFQPHLDKDGNIMCAAKPPAPEVPKK